MPYRNLGQCGLRVSLLSLGSWITFGDQIDDDLAIACMETARKFGCNFFDNAESYGDGRAEEVMGRALKVLAWPRWSYVVSTKFYRGIHRDPNMRKTLNRKYLLQAIDGSLKRLQLDFVDIVYCHRPDPGTPIEETVWTMHDIVSQGKALYWGTSEWKTTQLRAALEIAERNRLRMPVVEQPLYNLLTRSNVEQDLAPLCEEVGLGLTTASPLAGGLLSGKYAQGVPAGSRATVPEMDYLSDHFTEPDKLAKVARLSSIAAKLCCSLPQLAIAWCAVNPRVSSVITGASRPDQVVENFGALELIGRLDADVVRQIESAVS
jgi:voltage-dependent potassium channel beta subunit